MSTAADVGRWLELARATPDDWDGVFTAMNPDGLPPVVPDAARALYADAPWMLAAIPAEHRPVGWVERTLTWEVDDHVRDAALHLALAVAARRGETDGPPTQLPGQLLQVAEKLLAGEQVSWFDRLSRWGVAERLRVSGADWRWRLDEFEALGAMMEQPSGYIGDGGPEVTLQLTGGGRFVVSPIDWRPSDVGVPSICPGATLWLPAGDCDGADPLDALDGCLRRSGRLAPYQAVHWVGGGGNCECRVVRPGDPSLPPAMGLEVELFHAVGELLAAVRRGCERRLADSEWAVVTHLGRAAVELSEATGRPVDRRILGPNPDGGEWTGPAGIPVRRTRKGVTLLHVPAWVERWSVVRGAAARRIRLDAGGLIPPARSVHLPPAQLSDDPLPAGTPKVLAAAYKALREAVAAVVCLREQPASPSVNFEACRRQLIATGARGGDAVRAEPTGTPAAGESDHDPGPDESHEDALVQQAVGVVSILLHARAAYSAAERDLHAVAGAEGCAFRSVLDALSPAATLCERMLGLERHETRAHGRTVSMTVAGVAYHGGAAAVVPNQATEAARRLARIPDSALTAARAQVVRAVQAERDQARQERALHKAARRGGKDGMSKKARASAEMLELLNKNPEYYAFLKTREWGPLLNISHGTVCELEAWPLVMAKRDELLAKRQAPRGAKRRGRRRI